MRRPIRAATNVIGIRNPAVDKLVEKIVMAPNREDLVAATRALDRVLLWNYYVIPQWTFPFERIAYWDKFKRPAQLPSRGAYFPPDVVARSGRRQAARGPMRQLMRANPHYHPRFVIAWPPISEAPAAHHPDAVLASC